MQNIIIHENQISERGTSIAAFDYAYYVREILNINPVVVYDLKYDNVPAAVEKFQREFEVVGYTQFDEVQHLVDSRNIDYFYAIKYGYIDDIIVNNSINLMHSVFVYDSAHMHGQRYAVVSDWMSAKTNFTVPSVPHMLNLPSHDENYRKSFNIPADAVVVGRYGGMGTFDVPFVPGAVEKALNDRSDIWFMFANTPMHINHPRCIHVDVIIDLNDKVKFINTCDAMLHARNAGETFGLSVLEFAAKNKQIIAYYDDSAQDAGSGSGCGQNHFMYLQNNVHKYSTSTELVHTLKSITRDSPFNTEYLVDQFSPTTVMHKFNEVFIK